MPAPVVTISDYETMMLYHAAHCGCEGDLWLHDPRLLSKELPRIDAGTTIHWPRVRLTTQR